ncbi:MAG TPA: AMP nucleosidase [Saprospiraceae bacterium]|nr:AMP nucleosidase [Saprospiraceae bacterium]HND88491.1 AMP nucleosidase [Saprospiraceae bacterium]HNG88948.1 AMP nucleosidase [Saprospiraceae bacterium]
MEDILPHIAQSDLERIARENFEIEKSTKERMVKDWLPRYTGMPLEKFGDYILLVNFSGYVRTFADQHDVPVYGSDKPMQACTADGITIINFGIGSPNAGLVVDLLEAIHPKAVLFLGKCGGLKTSKNQVGDLILPIAAIRGEGTSNDYLPPEVPALPAFALQKAVSTTIRDYERDYWTGVVYTTNKRVWEHREDFKQRLRDLRCMAIDMETATIFVAAFKNQMPAGALLLVSDMPMTRDGIKTDASDRVVTANFADIHLRIGVDSLKQLMFHGKTVKHLRFEL